MTELPEIAQPAQGAEQPRVIALMQADARLVENVKHTGQTGADLGGEPDALRFAAGKRAAFAIESEIAEADFDEKSQPRLNLAHDFRDNLSLLRRQLEIADVIAPRPRSSAR